MLVQISELCRAMIDAGQQPCGCAHHGDGGNSRKQRNWNQQQERQPDPERNRENGVAHEDVRQALLHLVRAHVVGEVGGLAERAPTDQPEMSAVAVRHAHHDQRQLLAVDGELADALLIGFELRIEGEVGIVGDGGEAAHVGVVEQGLQILHDAGGIDLVLLPGEVADIRRRAPCRPSARPA